MIERTFIKFICPICLEAKMDGESHGLNSDGLEVWAFYCKACGISITSGIPDSMSRLGEGPLRLNLQICLNELKNHKIQDKSRFKHDVDLELKPLDSPSYQEVGPDIFLYKDILSHELCSKLINKFNLETIRKKPVEPRTIKTESICGDEKLIRLREEYRKCSMVSFSNFPDWSDEDLLICKAFHSAVKHHYYVEMDLIPAEFRFADEGFDLCCYAPGDICKLHFDSSTAPRATSAIIFLNTIESGGELVFPRQRVTVKPESGSCLLFPPRYSYKHLVNPANQNRYVIITWIQRITA